MTPYRSEAKAQRQGRCIQFRVYGWERDLAEECARKNRQNLSEMFRQLLKIEARRLGISWNQQ